MQHFLNYKAFNRFIRATFARNEEGFLHNAKQKQQKEKNKLKKPNKKNSKGGREDHAFIMQGKITW